MGKQRLSERSYTSAEEDLNLDLSDLKAKLLTVTA